MAAPNNPSNENSPQRGKIKLGAGDGDNHIDMGGLLVPQMLADQIKAERQLREAEDAERQRQSAARSNLENRPFTSSIRLILKPGNSADGRNEYDDSMNAYMGDGATQSAVGRIQDKIKRSGIFSQAPLANEFQAAVKDHWHENLDVRELSMKFHVQLAPSPASESTISIVNWARFCVEPELNYPQLIKSNAQMFESLLEIGHAWASHQSEIDAMDKFFKAISDQGCTPVESETHVKEFLSTIMKDSSGRILLSNEEINNIALSAQGISIAKPYRRFSEPTAEHKDDTMDPEKAKSSILDFLKLKYLGPLAPRDAEHERKAEIARTELDSLKGPHQAKLNFGGRILREIKTYVASQLHLSERRFQETLFSEGVSRVGNAVSVGSGVIGGLILGGLLGEGAASPHIANLVTLATTCLTTTIGSMIGLYWKRHSSFYKYENPLEKAAETEDVHLMLAELGGFLTKFAEAGCAGRKINMELIKSKDKDIQPILERIFTSKMTGVEVVQEACGLAPVDRAGNLLDRERRLVPEDLKIKRNQLEKILWAMDDITSKGTPFYQYSSWWPKGQEAKHSLWRFYQRAEENFQRIGIESDGFWKKTEPEQKAFIESVRGALKSASGERTKDFLGVGEVAAGAFGYQSRKQKWLTLAAGTATVASTTWYVVADHVFRALHM